MNRLGGVGERFVMFMDICKFRIFVVIVEECLFMGVVEWLNMV